MSLLTIGVNHTSAPVEVRERMSIPDSVLPDALSTLFATPSIEEAAIISTCNRTEMYCSVGSFEAGKIAAVEWLSEFHQFKIDHHQPYLYDHSDQETAKHMFRVASGLDSMVLGEPQILGQLKQA